LRGDVNVRGGGGRVENRLVLGVRQAEREEREEGREVKNVR
jgi:hypothetical protein